MIISDHFFSFYFSVVSTFFLYQIRMTFLMRKKRENIIKQTTLCIVWKGKRGSALKLVVPRNGHDEVW